MKTIHSFSLKVFLNQWITLNIIYDEVYTTIQKFEVSKIVFFLK